MIYSKHNRIQHNTFLLFLVHWDTPLLPSSGSVRPQKYNKYTQLHHWSLIVIRNNELWSWARWVLDNTPICTQRWPLCPQQLMFCTTVYEMVPHCIKMVMKMCTLLLKCVSLQTHTEEARLHKTYGNVRCFLCQVSNMEKHPATIKVHSSSDARSNCCLFYFLLISYRSRSSNHVQASVELSICLPDYKNTVRPFSVHSTALSLFHNPALSAGVFAVDFTLSEATGASSSRKGCERNRGGSFRVT